MLIAIAIIIAVLFGIHMLILLWNSCSKSPWMNQTLYLSGGQYAGDGQGAGHRYIVDEVDEVGTTVLQDYTMSKVTSSFSCVYIRLYQAETGRFYDAYLETALQIGRGAGDGEYAKLEIEEPSISKIHCMLYRRGEQILIQDMKSTNHTYVNGHRIGSAIAINHGDILQLGHCKYQFQCFYQR